MGLHGPDTSLKITGKRKLGDQEVGFRSRRDTAASTNTAKYVTKLEQEIYQSKAHFNNIPKIQSIAHDEFRYQKRQAQATIALSHIFAHLFTEEYVVQPEKVMKATTNVFANWQKQQMHAYADLLWRYIKSPNEFQQELGLTLGMELIAGRLKSVRDTQPLRSSDLLSQLLQTLLEHSSGDSLYSRYVLTYVDRFADVRLFTFSYIA